MSLGTILLRGMIVLTYGMLLVFPICMAIGLGSKLFVGIAVVYAGIAWLIWPKAVRDWKS